MSCISLDHALWHVAVLADELGSLRLYLAHDLWPGLLCHGDDASRSLQVDVLGFGGERGGEWVCMCAGVQCMKLDGWFGWWVCLNVLACLALRHVEGKPH